MNEERKQDKPTLDLEDLLVSVENAVGLDELLNDVMEKELQQRYKAREERKTWLINEIVESSKIYERMPLHRLALKLGENMDELYDLLEEVISKDEISGAVISGSELIFNRIQKAADLGQKPMLIMKPALAQDLAPDPSRPTMLPHQPLKRRQVPVSFKVMEKPSTRPAGVEVTASAPPSLVMTADHAFSNAQVQIILTIANESTTSLDEVHVKVLAEGDIVLLRARPMHVVAGTSRDEIVLPSIPPATSKRVSLFFIPARCGTFEFLFHAQARDASGNFIDESSSRQVTMPDLTFTRTPETVDEEEFQRLVQQELGSKGIKSFGMPPGANAVEVYLIMKEILLVNGFELVGEKLDETADSFLGWYHAMVAREGGNGNRFIAIAQVMHGKMEIFAMASNEKELACGLISLASSLRDALESRELVPVDGLMELCCIACGGTFSRQPAPGDVYTCKYCDTRMQF